MKRLLTILAMIVAIITSSLAASSTLGFVATSTSGAKISFNVVSSDGTWTPTVKLQYSSNGTTWRDYTYGTEFSLAKGVGILFRASERVIEGTDVGFSTFSKDANNYIQFTSTGSVKAAGNIMCLLSSTGDKTAVPTYAFVKLFSGCTGLTTAPDLPATTLGGYCYSAMFNGCTSLKKAPNLPAETLKDHCYSNMLNGCSALTTAPEISATTLAQYCCNAMFADCTSLMTAPVLHAKTLTTRCYNQMFKGCSKLNSLSVAFTDWGIDKYATIQWLEGVSSQGTITCSHTLEYKRGISYVPNGWGYPYLCLTAQQKIDISFIIRGNGDRYYAYWKYEEPKLQVSVNGCKTWSDYSFGSKITLEKGEKAYFVAKDTNKDFSHGENCGVKLTSSGSFAASGNVMSLIESTCPDSLSEGAFAYLFSGCTGLTQAPELPATKLGEDCYYRMFFNCKKLKQAPVLPAETLAKGCYSNMFGGCSALLQAPKLPVTQLTESCYSSMFENCTSLTDAPELPATEAPASCYSGMFEGCTSLKTAPKLPATKLEKFCYSLMFKGCTGLTTAPELPARKLNYCCYSYMFAECTNLTDVPELPATYLQESSYHKMFTGCTGLKSLTVAFLDWNTSNRSTENWLEDVSETGTLYCLEGLDTTVERGGSTIPEGWRVSQGIIAGPTIVDVAQLVDKLKKGDSSVKLDDIETLKTKILKK